MDLMEFFVQFQDHLAPKLDTYEQAIYLYIFRKSRLLGLHEVTIGFKTDRSRLATGIGEGGKPMSEKSCYSRLHSLEEKAVSRWSAQITQVDSSDYFFHLRFKEPSRLRPKSANLILRKWIFSTIQ